MTDINSPVLEDIRRRSKVFGIVLGLFCLPTALIGGAIGGCCPLGAFIGIIPVTFWAFWAGFLAAMFLDWSSIGHEEALSVGTQVGLRTGLIASLIGAGATFVIYSFSSGSFAGAAGMAGMSEGASHVGSTVAGGFLGLFFMNLLVAIVALIPGTALGVVGGVFGAAIKRK